MNNLGNAGGQQTGMQINIESLIKILIRKWWLVLILTIVFSTCGAILSEFTRVDTFSAGIIFIVSNRTKASEQVAESISSSDIMASISMTNNFKYLLTGSTMCKEIAASLGTNENEITPEKIKDAIGIKSINETSIIEITVKTKDADLSKKIADALVSKYKAVVAVYQGAEINVYAQPELATAHDPNSSTVIYGIVGGIFGILLAVTSIALSNVLRDTIQSAEDIRENFDISIIATVSQVVKKKKKGNRPEKNLLISDRASGFGFIETYKSIRTKIEGIASKNGYKTFVVSSAVENEGKTTVATNIALALAQNGKTVLLIDADFRKPSVCKLLRIPNGIGTGLPDVINGVCAADKAIRYVEKNKLFLLAGTVSSRNPTELLSMPKTANIIKSFSKDFDFVIIDTPPVGIITDASIIAKYADALILVIKEDAAPISRINISISDLTESGTELIGCVYNNVTSSIINSYGNYRYGKYSRSKGYSYGYGSNYNSDSKRNDEIQ
ncbi:MAG: polysaccharide biosynthesis tyrosine autokinase [Eubacteriales bacterium]